MSTATQSPIMLYTEQTPNPESFAFYGMRRYFADKNRSAILRLSRDGITEISMYGMTDFFRDELATIKDGWSNFEMSNSVRLIKDFVCNYNIFTI